MKEANKKPMTPIDAVRSYLRGFNYDSHIEEGFGYFQFTTRDKDDSPYCTEIRISDKGGWVRFDIQAHDLEAGLTFSKEWKGPYGTKMHLVKLGETAWNIYAEFESKELDWDKISRTLTDELTLASYISKNLKIPPCALTADNDTLCGVLSSDCPVSSFDPSRMEKSEPPPARAARVRAL